MKGRRQLSTPDTTKRTTTTTTAYVDWVGKAFAKVLSAFKIFTGDLPVWELGSRAGTTSICGSLVGGLPVARTSLDPSDDTDRSSDRLEKLTNSYSDKQSYQKLEHLYYPKRSTTTWKRTEKRLYSSLNKPNILFLSPNEAKVFVIIRNEIEQWWNQVMFSSHFQLFQFSSVLTQTLKWPLPSRSTKSKPRQCFRPTTEQ